MNTTGLSDRQLDVLELALCGLTHQQIGRRLYVSHDTIKSHFRRIYAKVRDEQGEPAAGALHAVSLALNQGWLVYDPVKRGLTRPEGRHTLPTYAEQPTYAAQEVGDAFALPSPAERTLQQRRAELGW